ncbi:MAG: hypothetical protein JZU58_24115 [Curvibacter lanceolatus]|uniref:hypothetical protein n=1 Tax=Curvibacter lanceolatus TaxID=86182 RepID=UPI000365D67A|nr:hypothetical protein [Curvibacter lanceolatus]MBV5295434.1 hypothetical protein [Curvibacter lanceolatus]
MLRKPEDFQKAGSKVFQKAPIHRRSIDGWIVISKGNVADAQRESNSPTTRIGAAYDALLNLSLAVLSSQGWRAGSADGHHMQTLEAACAYAGITESVHDQVDAIRDLRNNQYQGIEPSADDILFALKVLDKVAPELLSLLGRPP